MRASVAQLLSAFGSGLGIGLFFFGGLWLTVREIPRVRRPALLSMLSFVGRSSVSLAIFYFIVGLRWERVAAALAGFILMRFILVRMVQPAPFPAKPKRR